MYNIKHIVGMSLVVGVTHVIVTYGVLAFSGNISLTLMTNIIIMISFMIQRRRESEQEVYKGFDKLVLYSKEDVDEELLQRIIERTGAIDRSYNKKPLLEVCISRDTNPEMYTRRSYTLGFINSYSSSPDIAAKEHMEFCSNLGTILKEDKNIINLSRIRL